MRGGGDGARGLGGEGLEGQSMRSVGPLMLVQRVFMASRLITRAGLSQGRLGGGMVGAVARRPPSDGLTQSGKLVAKSLVSGTIRKSSWN